MEIDNKIEANQPDIYILFLARMQPVHNAHLYMVNKALEESDKVLK